MLLVWQRSHGAAEAGHLAVLLRVLGFVPAVIHTAWAQALLAQGGSRHESPIKAGLAGVAVSIALGLACALAIQLQWLQPSWAGLLPYLPPLVLWQAGACLMAAYSNLPFQRSPARAYSYASMASGSVQLLVLCAPLALALQVSSRRPCSLARRHLGGRPARAEPMAGAAARPLTRGLVPAASREPLGAADNTRCCRSYRCASWPAGVLARVHGAGRRGRHDCARPAADQRSVQATIARANSANWSCKSKSAASASAYSGHLACMRCTQRRKDSTSALSLPYPCHSPFREHPVSVGHEASVFLTVSRKTKGHPQSGCPSQLRLPEMTAPHPVHRAPAARHHQSAKPGNRAAPAGKTQQMVALVPASAGHLRHGGDQREHQQGQRTAPASAAGSHLGWAPWCRRRCRRRSGPRRPSAPCAPAARPAIQLVPPGVFPGASSPLSPMAWGNMLAGRAKVSVSVSG